MPGANLWCFTSRYEDNYLVFPKGLRRALVQDFLVWQITPFPRVRYIIAAGESAVKTRM